WYRPGFKIWIDLRLAQVLTGFDNNGNGSFKPSFIAHPTDSALDAGDQVVRRYDFVYTVKPTTNNQADGDPFSKLAAIQRYDGNGNAFPSTMRFSYSAPGTRFQTGVSWQNPSAAPSLSGRPFALGYPGKVGAWVAKHVAGSGHWTWSGTFDWYRGDRP